ncbi:Vacuolar protein sorting-associate protein Vta1/Callose synthase, N-terminal domain containing protein [Trema orientale]|uniref:Vacuolar protein sorting-associate protein Vta1/Callose synthase, N-terminal domain containing protein n=1 Tax=Trema orientale TaxID=63057 RepID=A0A2P5EXP6_TREOI|nr:Vacuolar protein sorting-associate protein Vta1/Callose synthase, N-terminal domain containing protein [Trema orientale]
MKLPEYGLEIGSSVGFDRPFGAMENGSPINYDPSGAEEEEKKVVELLDKVEMMQNEVDNDEDDSKTKHLTNIIDECVKDTKKVRRLLGNNG